MKAWKLLRSLLVTVAAAVGVAWFVLLEKVTSAPTMPVLGTQNIVPSNNHGVIHYITPFQDTLLDWLVPVGIVFILIGQYVEKRLRGPGDGFVALRK